MVCNLKARFLAHGLHLGDEFSCKAFLDERIGEVRIEHDGQAVVRFGNKACLLLCGNEDVILCERGIRTFETYTRNTLDLAAIPVLRRLTHLPVVVDPSHTTGDAKLVHPTSLAATAVGADGLIVEVHNNPPRALCDGAQSLTPSAFATMMKDVEAIRPFAYRG